MSQARATWRACGRFSSVCGAPGISTSVAALWSFSAVPQWPRACGLPSQALEGGYYLGLLALISVNLGLINLLPVPVLDGGHVLVFAIEAVRGKPLPSKTRDRIQSAGLAIVVLITLLAIRNDVMRYVIR